jgi:hypothetical protein
MGGTVMPGGIAGADTTKSSAMPRRAAMQGLAGALSGMVALGAIGASANKKNKNKNKNKNKKNKNKGKGTLRRVELATTTDAIAVSSTETVTATCPNPSSDETVVILGGGFDIVLNAALPAEVTVLQSTGTTNPAAWAVEVNNASAANQPSVTAQAVCGYFKA